MSTITVRTECGTTRQFGSRRDAEEGKRTHQQLCESCEEEDIEITVEPEPATPELGPVTDRPAEAAEPGPLPAEPRSLPAGMPETVRTDPLDIVPEYMITEVEGQPTINKRGYAVIAHHFDIAVQSEAITTAGETDHEYAEFKATAWKKDEGPENGYTGHATARASEARRGIENNLNEMAETRAMKRAVAWASGVGLLAWEEMVEHVDGR